MPTRASALDAWMQAGHYGALSLPALSAVEGSKGRAHPPSLSFDKLRMLDKLRMPLSTN
jgi:hypothetical protein